MGWAVVVGIVLIAASSLALMWAARMRQATGLPGGRIISQDTGPEERGRPLFSARYGLTGTPDYVIRTSRGLVPVEVKPARKESEPHDSHLLQVLAYCLLLKRQRESGRRMAFCATAPIPSRWTIMPKRALTFCR